MSSETYIVLRLQGPLQSWGFDSQYNRRSSGLMPTKSGIAGICCAALGCHRGSEKERSFLESFVAVKMTSIALPRKGKTARRFGIGRMKDYHTVGGGYDPQDPDERQSITTKAKDGKPRVKNEQALAVLTRRYYLTDADFGVILSGDEHLLKKIGTALQNPVWGLWLGRKSCIPSTPIFTGEKSSYEDALRLIIGDQLIDQFETQEDVAEFTEGVDAIPDSPVSFDCDKRVFVPRRIKNTRQRITSNANE